MVVYILAKVIFRFRDTVLNNHKRSNLHIEAGVGAERLKNYCF